MTAGNEFLDELGAEWAGMGVSLRYHPSGLLEVGADSGRVVPIIESLVRNHDYQLASLAVRQVGSTFLLHYLLYGRSRPAPWVQCTVSTPGHAASVPSLSTSVHAADWLERESEDHFGMHFGGHPRLGDFVLHDEEWQEEVAPMRKSFDPRIAAGQRRPNADWRPRKILHAPGGFTMTVGPIHGGIAEPVHYLVETTGEDMTRVFPRLFYKYRAVEKQAEGRTIEEALLLAERFDALHAFSHSLACCLAAERALEAVVSPGDSAARVLFAELERLRSHMGTIRAICGSTGLAVAESRAAIYEEELLRLCGEVAGHRYLFGLNTIGGLTRAFDAGTLQSLSQKLTEFGAQLHKLERDLGASSSFLDRLEEVGVITLEQAAAHGLVGPVARATGYGRDLRVTQPYSGYDRFDFEAASETEGDGYARLRILFFEAYQSIRIIEQVATGPARARGPEEPFKDDRQKDAAFGFGWVEAPCGAAVHSLWLDENGRVERYRIVPPSFLNWHGFHVAAEGFAFQDLPIILSTFGLSVAESDR